MFPLLVSRYLHMRLSHNPPSIYRSSPVASQRQLHVFPLPLLSPLPLPAALPFHILLQRYYVDVADMPYEPWNIPYNYGRVPKARTAPSYKRLGVARHDFVGYSATFDQFCKGLNRACNTAKSKDVQVCSSSASFPFYHRHGHGLHW